MDAHTHTHATNPKEFQPVIAIGTNLKENKIGQATPIFGVTVQGELKALIGLNKTPKLGG